MAEIAEGSTMSVFSNLAGRARGAATAAQGSLDRAKIERARRVAERRQEAALANLGRRVRELALADSIPVDRIEPELASVRAMEMQIEALQAELDELITGPRDPSRSTGPPSPSGDDTATPDRSAAPNVDVPS